MNKFPCHVVKTTFFVVLHSKYFVFWIVKTTPCLFYNENVRPEPTLECTLIDCPLDLRMIMLMMMKMRLVRIMVIIIRVHLKGKLGDFLGLS